jgi:hydroxymethylpyrimidine pyrophosphatase-like HAD family hydrolase
VPHVAGDCLVEAGAEHAHGVLDAIRSRELPLAILFNRGRLMVLSEAVSKATGLRQVLTILRLSLRSTIGSGDAENDHHRPVLRKSKAGAT